MWTLLLLIHLRDWLGGLNLSVLFPAVLMLLNVAAAIVSFSQQDWRRGVYWLASAVCIAMVAFR